MEIWPQMPVGVLNRSLGRALEWHSRGQRFDPAYLHHEKSCIRKDAGFFLFPRCFEAAGVSTNHLAGCCIAASGVLYALPATRIFHGCRTTLRKVLFMGLTM